MSDHQISIFFLFIHHYLQTATSSEWPSLKTTYSANLFSWLDISELLILSSCKVSCLQWVYTASLWNCLCFLISVFGSSTFLKTTDYTALLWSVLAVFNVNWSVQFWQITTKWKEHDNQSQLEAKACSLCQARENGRKPSHAWARFGFWLVKKYYVFSNWFNLCTCFQNSWRAQPSSKPKQTRKSIRLST